MTKPGQRGSRYAPRGTAYAPRGRRRGIQEVDGREALRSVAAKPREIAKSSTTQVPSAADAASSVMPSLARRWQPRQSVALPVAMTVAAIALMQQFPAYRLEARTAQPIAARYDTRAVDLARIAIAPDESVPTLSSATAPATAREQATMTLSATPAEDVAVRDVGHLGAVPLVRACSISDAAPSDSIIEAVSLEQFGSALASAAEAQTREFVVYDDKYRVIRYPGGDVATLYGVCTDVIVRAYRALGVDLQRLVHESHVGSGDTNISHRRVEALRRFFKKSGASVPITDFAEDYQAGDVVTYHRPQNSGSNDHIAIVSNVTGPSGKPMIVHNRGFGPQVEDALFVNEITGHFRYRGPTPAQAAPVSAVLPAAASQSGLKAENRAVAKRVAQRASHRMRNSVVRKVRRAAAVRAASGTSAKPAPKL